MLRPRGTLNELLDLPTLGASPGRFQPILSLFHSGRTSFIIILALLLGIEAEITGEHRVDLLLKRWTLQLGHAHAQNSNVSVPTRLRPFFWAKMSKLPSVYSSFLST